MPNNIKERVPNKGKGVNTTHQQSKRPSCQSLQSPISNDRRHTALAGAPGAILSAEGWRNVNRAILKTVDIVLSKNATLDSRKPDYWEIDEGLGVALVAEIRREIRETCTFANPKLKERLRQVAWDVTQKEFRFPYKGGGVWFWFKLTDLYKASQPITESDEANMSEKDIVSKDPDDDIESAIGKDNPIGQATSCIDGETPSESAPALG
ncbi:hypothetical protein F5Y11DRAFT_167711 [Daldinia sp. FL1419]|nr:hypothetical protein F5Y11DRAFT_167711 [Daldinia sp. FL1419]